MSDTTTPAASAQHLTELLGGEWHDKFGKAPCPGHNGTDNNLEISTGDNGRILLKCWSRGCSYGQIVDGLGDRNITMLRPPKPKDRLPGEDDHDRGVRLYRQEWSYKEHHGKFTMDRPGPSAAKELEEKLKEQRSQYKHFYRYYSPDGYPMCCIVRTDAHYDDHIWEEKRFYCLTWGRVEHDAPEWHGRFPVGLRPLYGLEKLVNSGPNVTIIVHEGEKKADAAQQKLDPSCQDFICLSIMGGWRGVPLTDYAPIIDYPSIIYYPDNDEPGNLGMRQFIKQVPQAWAVRVDDLAPGEDAADDTFRSQPDIDAWLGERVYRPLSLRQALTSTAWGNREIAQPKPLLGELITSITRMFIVGATGLGKTMLALAMALAIATGSGFLHWKAGKQKGVVLYIDGEMAPIVTRQRIMDEQARAGQQGGDDLMVYSRMWEQHLLKICPEQAPMPPLNTEAGYKWFCDFLNTLGPVDVVFLDNIMSLCEGVQREEESFTGLLPIIDELTKRDIALVCLDHTGHNRARQYGSSAKQWRFDTVGMMTSLRKEGEEDNEPQEDTKGLRPFRLSFDEPAGKARMKTPANWGDFKQLVIGIKDNHWYTEEQGRQLRLMPYLVPFLDALREVAVLNEAGKLSSTKQAWQEQCMYRSLIEAEPTSLHNEHWKERDKRMQKFRTAMSELSQSRVIVAAGEIIYLINPDAQ